MGFGPRWIDHSQVCTWSYNPIQPAEECIIDYFASWQPNTATKRKELLNSSKHEIDKIECEFSANYSIEGHMHWRVRKEKHAKGELSHEKTSTLPISTPKYF